MSSSPWPIFTVPAPSTVPGIWKALSKYDYTDNQIHYDNTVEVRNRFTGLDLTDRVPDELWTETTYRME